MEHPKSNGDEASRMRFGGMLLFVASFMLWLYRHDLHPVNYIIVVLLMFRAVEYAVSKTSLLSRRMTILNLLALLDVPKYTPLLSLCC